MLYFGSLKHYIHVHHPIFFLVFLNFYCYIFPLPVYSVCTVTLLHRESAVSEGFQLEMVSFI